MAITSSKTVSLTELGGGTPPLSKREHDDDTQPEKERHAAQNAELQEPMGPELLRQHLSAQIKSEKRCESQSCIPDGGANLGCRQRIRDHVEHEKPPDAIDRHDPVVEILDLVALETPEPLAARPDDVSPASRDLISNADLPRRQNKIVEPDALVEARGLHLGAFRLCPGQDKI